jgi:hypothetical protein
MNVRIGVCLGQAGVPDQFSAAVDALEAAGVGSLWLPEMVCGSLVGPFSGMARAGPDVPPEDGDGVAVVPRCPPVPEPIPVANAVNTSGQPRTALDMPHAAELGKQ